MFTFPGLLWFLPLLGAVVLIHFINMFRHRRVEWGAMEFILASYKKSRTRILLQQLLLMFLRTLAVATVILMFAGPKLEGKLAGWLGGGTHHIILLDDSYSMNERNLTQGGTLLFDDAIAVIQKIVENGISGNNGNDRLSLLRLSSAEPVLYELPLRSDNLTEVHNALNILKPSSFAHDPETMLIRGGDLARQSVGLNPVIYFLSDFRRRNWENPAPFLTQIETIRQHGGTVRLIRIAQAEQPNLGIEQLHIVEGIHAADIDILIDATVVNYGSEVADNVLVTLFIDDQMRAQQTILHILPGSKTVPPVRFPIKVIGTEPHRVEVRLQPDALPDDNQRHIALQVPEFLEILLITPSFFAVRESSAQFVRVALAPGGTKSGIRIRHETPSYLSEKPLESYSAIFLLDLPSLEPAAVRALENYVSNGGGVAFFPGTDTDLDFVRTQLYKSGTGLFPAAPVMVQELLPDYLTNVSDVRVLPHPIFRLFGDGESPLLSSLLIERYLAVEPVNDSSVNVLATLRNDVPLVLEKRFGTGKTMTFLTSASPVWNNWARNPSYVVVFLELAAWLSKRPEQMQTLLVGDPIMVAINPMEFEERVLFTSPPHEEESLPPPPREGNYSPPSEGGYFSQQNVGMVTLQTDRPGFYTISKKLRSGTEQSELREVNVNASEGDIRQLDITEIADLLRPVRLPPETAASFSTTGEFSGKQSVSDWLLCLAILFLLGEMFLAGRILPMR